MNRKPKIAVVLSGCGVFDGAEIHESVLTLLAINRQGGEYQCFAPDVPQAHVIDHRSGKETGETRNVLTESARIARGKIEDLAAFRAEDYDALMFPGGFGAAKNLSTFAFDGPDCTVQKDVSAAIAAMRAAGKPIGALCISPAIMAKVMGDVELTIGSDAATAAALGKMGARHKVAGHGEVVVDRKARLATTPCYMLDAGIGQIAEGADNVVRAVLEMAKEVAA